MPEKGVDRYTTYSETTTQYLNESDIRNGIDILTQHIARPHTEQDKEIYRIAVEQLNNGERLNYSSLPDRLKTHKNQHSFFDRFKVVDANASFSQTVVAHIAKDGHYYIHPDIKQNRSLTVQRSGKTAILP